MPIPWEALIPFGAASTSSTSWKSDSFPRSLDCHVWCRWNANEHFAKSTERRQGMLHGCLSVDLEQTVCCQPPRFKLTKWEEALMERDRRMTGSKRGQMASELHLFAFPLWTDNVFKANPVRVV